MFEATLAADAPVERIAVDRERAELAMAFACAVAAAVAVAAPLRSP
jgi:hypothetical protein